MMKKNSLTMLTIVIFCGVAVGKAPAEYPVPITGDISTDFGIYRPVIVDVTPSIPAYTPPNDLSDVSNIDYLHVQDDVKALLTKNRFACTASPYRQVYDIYNANVTQKIPAFVTTDACLHTYHILYDYMLRILELQYFFDDIVGLTNSMIAAMQEISASAGEESVKQAALDNIAYLSVALKLLDETAEIDERVAAEVADEVEQILALSDGYVPSPLFYRDGYPYREDYSQYNPRGHYTRTPEFERYFRAMMWYGRITFSLNLPLSTRDGLRRTARQALLLARALVTAKVGGEDAASVWDRIYQPTVFFVGKTDDLTYQSYLGIAATVFGNEFTSASPDILADDGVMDQFITLAVEDLPNPEITVVAGKGFRFMGQRYIPDSFMLDQLVFEFVEGRLMPRGLDVMAVLGSMRAYEILDVVYEDTKYPNYIEQMAKLKTLFSSYAPDVWAQNLYYNWLYALVPLLEVKGEGYPLFMRSEAWIDKNLNTALGSWAELRHDTILYAKQSETRETGEPPAPKCIRGYVEPEPEVYARLAALADFMKRGLDSRNLLDSEVGKRLDQFIDLMLSLKDIAIRELQNTPPTETEYVLMCNFGGIIEALTSFPPEYSSQYESDADDYMAVIADVHTDPNSNTALEVGVGHPLIMYVIAPVDGQQTLTRGGIFSYHEFTWPLADQRLTDEAWQELQSSENAQPMPVWTESFLAGESSLKSETHHYYSEGKVITAVEDAPVPGLFELRQNYPNPFNPSTVITFRILTADQVKLAVYNLAGQEVETLADKWMPSGEYSVTWKPENLSSGVYLIRITAGGRTASVKALYMK